MTFYIVKTNAPKSTAGYRYITKVVELIKKETPSLYRVKVLGGLEKVEFTIFIKDIKNVTPVYNKIVKLRKKYNWCDEFKWRIINKIRNNFEKGIYPTESEFNLMNQYHNDLITGREVPRNHD